jgi:hypothetical protein
MSRGFESLGVHIQGSGWECLKVTDMRICRSKGSGYGRIPSTNADIGDYNGPIGRLFFVEAKYQYWEISLILGGMVSIHARWTAPSSVCKARFCW